MLNELKENFDEYDEFVAWYSHSPYSNTLLENCQRWQLREALSFYLSRPQIHNKIKTVLDSLLTDHLVEYDELSLIDEATIQHLVRLKGYEFIGVNTWPNNSLLLAEKLVKVDKATLLKYQVIDRLLRFYNSIDFDQLFKDYKHALVYLVGSILFFDLTLFVYSILIGYCLWLVADIVRHDYIEHQYIVPKNNIIKYLIDAFMYLTVPLAYYDKTTLVETHRIHHRLWKTDQDTFTSRVRSELIPGLKECDLSLFKKPIIDIDGKFKYFIEVKLTVLVVLSLLYGIQNVLFLVLIPLALINVLSFQHDWYFYRFGEKNYPWLFPLALNQAWHLEHHRTFKHQPKKWDQIFNGPTWSMYLNPQYYILRLLFKLNTGVAR